MVWLKRNWKVLALVLLALAGLALALANFLEPCATEAVISYKEVQEEIEEEVLVPTEEIVTVANETIVVIEEEVEVIVPVTIANETTYEVESIETTTVNNTYVRLVPMDMHVALDHSGSMQYEDKFINAKLGIKRLWETISDTAIEISQRADAEPGSTPNLRFALSKWNFNAPEEQFALQALAGAITGVTNFVQTPNGGTAISTGLTSCMEELLPANTDPPTKAPTLSPTLEPEIGSVVSIGAGDQTKTKTCLVVTDGVAFDSDVVFLDGKNNEEYETECLVEANKFIDDNTDMSEPTKTLLRNCGSTITNLGAPSTVATCVALDIAGTGCTVRGIATAMRNKGVVIVGMYVGGSEADIRFGRPFLKELTSCGAIPEADCPFFVSTDAGQIVTAAESLANALTDQFSSTNVTQSTTFTNTTTTTYTNTTYTTTYTNYINTTYTEYLNTTYTSYINTTYTSYTNTTVSTVLEEATEYICTGDPLYFFFLMFLAPVAAYIFWRPFSLLFARYCCPPAREEPEFTYMTQAPQRAPPQPRAIVPVLEVMEERESEPSWHVPVEIEPPPPVIPVAPEPNTLIKEKRYKWSIKASDAYIWSTAGGAGPMNVNFNGVAPPSAPKREAIPQNMKRRTQRVSMRWSYVPPEKRASARVSTRITSALYDMAIPNYDAPDRLEPFEEHEMQPGDIDYEYTMCLMRWFPCLRPKKSKKQQPASAAATGALAPIGEQRSEFWQSEYGGSEFDEESPNNRGMSEYSQSQASQSQYGTGAASQYSPSPFSSSSEVSSFSQRPPSTDLDDDDF